jgi:Iron-binding zinc finger CDGSH type
MEQRLTTAQKRGDRSPASEVEPAATVTVYPNGPLVVRGDFAVRGIAGDVITGARVVALCRCGRSALKPLCDGSHKRNLRRHAPDGPIGDER